jgi:hypothetical protein
MTEPPSNPHESVSQTTNRRIRWDALAAIIAALIGLLALCVSGYTAYIQRQQVSAQVWPHLHIAQSTFPPEIYVENQGVGPAIVRNVEVLVGGKPQPDWDHVFAAVGMHGDINTQGPAMGGYVLTPGQVTNWVDFGFTRDQYQAFLDAIKAAPAGSAQPVPHAPEMSYELFEGNQRVLFRQFMDGAQRTQLQIRICYCSTLGDCKLATWAADLRERHTQACKAVPKADQFRQ